MAKKIKNSSKTKCPPAPDQIGNFKRIKPANNNSPVRQRARILRSLRKFNRLSTLQARERLGIMSPASRVKELREMGHIIRTDRQNEADVTGTKHRTGVYVYMGFADPKEIKEGALCRV